MPEIYFRIKIKGGKKTETEIEVSNFSAKNKTIEFQNGKIISDSDFAKMIENTVERFIKTT